jgi:hypothetical protein
MHNDIHSPPNAKLKYNILNNVGHIWVTDILIFIYISVRIIAASRSTAMFCTTLCDNKILFQNLSDEMAAPSCST